MGDWRGYPSRGPIFWGSPKVPTERFDLGCLRANLQLLSGILCKRCLTNRGQCKRQP